MSIDNASAAGASAAAQGAMLSATGIRKSFGTNTVLKGVSLSVAKGEVVTLIGSSGSGKSTFLRCMNLLELPHGGELRVGPHHFVFAEDKKAPGDAQQSALRRDIGMVFQHFNLFPHMTALENVIEAPMQVKGMARAEAVALAEDLLAKVGLTDKAAAYPSRLSGGQKQRVAIARALCMEPKVLLFDEPTSALDPELIGEVLRVMEDLAHEGTTMIVVTHEMHFAREAADRVVFMEEGVVCEQGPPEQMLDAPRTEATKRFLRRFLVT